MNAGSRPPRYVPESRFLRIPLCRDNFPTRPATPLGIASGAWRNDRLRQIPSDGMHAGRICTGSISSIRATIGRPTRFWESLWHACGRASVEADFLRSLIRLAAAGVKAREGRPKGTASHAAAALALLQRIQGQIGGGCQRYMGLSLSELCDDAAAASEGRVVRHVIPGTGMIVMFSCVLHAA